MSAAEIRCGVVGTGHLGRLHARILSELPGAVLAGVVDAVPERAEAVAREYRCAACPTIEALLAQDIRFAVVATPTERHYEVGRILLGAGVATLIEKPFTRTIEEVLRLVPDSLREALAMRRDLHQDAHPALAQAMDNLSSALVEVGEVEEAEPGIEPEAALEPEAGPEPELEDLEGLDEVHELSEEEIIDRDLAIQLFRMRIFEAEELRIHERMALATEDLGSALFFLFTRDDSPLESRIDSITSRLEKVPEYLERSKSSLTSPCRLWTEIALETGRALGSFLDTIESHAVSMFGRTDRTARLSSAVKRAKEALEAVGLGHRLQHRPNQLSGGQQQRVAIARALVNRPSVILADEPTGNLDSHSSVEVLDLLHELHQQGTTIVMVTHEPDVARHAQRIIWVHDGKVVSEGRDANPAVLDGHILAKELVQ